MYVYMNAYMRGWWVCPSLCVRMCGTPPFCNFGPVTSHISQTAVTKAIQLLNKRLRYSQVFNDNARKIAFGLKYLHLTLLSLPEFGSLKG